MTKVYIIESERGWGQKVDEVKEFDTPREAEVFCYEYNSKHNPPRDQVPDWYMFARLEDGSAPGMGGGIPARGLT